MAKDRGKVWDNGYEQMSRNIPVLLPCQTNLDWAILGLDDLPCLSPPWSWPLQLYGSHSISLWWWTGKRLLSWGSWTLHSSIELVASQDS